MLLHCFLLWQKQPLHLAGVLLVGKWPFRSIGPYGPAVPQWTSPALRKCNLIPDLIFSVICKFFPGSTLLPPLFFIYLLFYPSGRNLKNLASGIWSETSYVVKLPCQLVIHDVIKNGSKKSQMSKWLRKRGRKTKIQVWHYRGGRFVATTVGLPWNASLDARSG